MAYADPFIIIGENIHATRVLARTSRHVAASGEHEWIVFTDAEGRERHLPVPAWHQESEGYAAGRVKHVAIAVRTAMDPTPSADDAQAYLQMLVARQVSAGAAYLDLNMDELWPQLGRQKDALRWLVRQVQSWTHVPVSIDSSHPEIIAEGLAACRPGSHPMLNSASLERRSTLDLAVASRGPVVVTAAGASGMPQTAESRVDNASAMVDLALSAGISPDDIFVDPLVFPLAVDGAFGRHALDAMRTLRARFGSRIHITGGMSNVSFGIPGRRLINETFLRLAMMAGADSGIIDPVATDLTRVRTLNVDSGAHALARDAILGLDVDCRAFLRAYRAGALAEHGAPPPMRRGA